MSDDFDGMVLAAQMGQNKMAEQALWKATFALDAWYFVADQHGDDVAPVIGALDGKPHLIAFTDETRAEVFSASRAQKRGGEPTPTLHMEVADAVAYCEDLREQNVDGVLFNNGGYSFHAGMSHIMDMFKRYAKG